MPVTIAVSGDWHKRDRDIYGVLKTWEKNRHKKIDAVLCTGDLDAVVHRDEEEADIDSLILEYAFGRRKAPMPTYFISGNNDEYDYLNRFRQGGFIAPNFYYLGRNGMVDVKGIKIAGLSGVFRKDMYQLPLDAYPNFLEWQFYREQEIAEIMKYKADIVLFHNWIKPFSSIENSDIPLGFPKSQRRDTQDNHLLEVVQAMQPRYVFMGHMDHWYMSGNIGDSKIYGLKRVPKAMTIQDVHSYKVISIQPY
jgi:lariat debranching enzyme